jgi:hypothetical protein
VGPPPGTAAADAAAPYTSESAIRAAEPLNQTAVVQAVARGLALPLERIVPIAERSGAGKVIDAALVQVRSRLVYKITMLNDTGLSRQLFFAARSGRYLGER